MATRPSTATRILGFLDDTNFKEVISLDHLLHDVLKLIKPVLDYVPDLDTHFEAAGPGPRGFWVSWTTPTSMQVLSTAGCGKKDQKKDDKGKTASPARPRHPRRR